MSHAACRLARDIMTEPILQGARIVLLEQFFYPEGWGGAEITRDIADRFAGRGCRLEVICGTEQYAPIDGDPGPDPRQAGIVIRRIPPLPGDRDIQARKAIRQLWFCVWAVALLLFRRPPDIFVAQTNPPPAIVLVALVAALWRKPFLLIAMDVYPEVLVAHGAMSSRGAMTRLARAVFGWAYRSATRVVVLGPVMAERMIARGVARERLLEIGNWSTGPLGLVRGSTNALRRELGLDDCFVLHYSGNLGVGHEFDTLLRGFAIARAQAPNLRLVFFGKGARLAETQNRVRELNLSSSVTFAPLVPACRLPESMGLADLGIVTLREGFEGLMVPSKLAGYLARGIPVLYVGPPSDASTVIARYTCGFAVCSADAAGVAEAILESLRNRERLAQMGSSAQRGYEVEMTRDLGLSRYEAALHACLRARRGSSRS